MADELLRALGKRQKDADESMNAPAPQAGSEGAPVDAEATRPFDGEERAELLDAVFAEVDAVAGEADAPAPPVDLAARRAARGRTLVAAAIAVAAAVLLFLFLRGDAQDPGAPEIAKLPDYALTELRGAKATTRDDPDAPPTEVALDSDATLEVVLTPAKAVRESVTLVVIATRSGEDSRLLEAAGVVVTEQGAIRWQGTVDTELGLQPGQWSLEFVVVPAGSVPKTVEAASNEAFPRTRIKATISPR